MEGGTFARSIGFCFGKRNRSAILFGTQECTARLRTGLAFSPPWPCITHVVAFHVMWPAAGSTRGCRRGERARPPLFASRSARRALNATVPFRGTLSRRRGHVFKNEQPAGYGRRTGPPKSSSNRLLQACRRRKTPYAGACIILLWWMAILTRHATRAPHCAYHWSLERLRSLSLRLFNFCAKKMSADTTLEMEPIRHRKFTRTTS